MLIAAKASAPRNTRFMCFLSLPPALPEAIDAWRGEGGRYDTSTRRLSVRHRECQGSRGFIGVRFDQPGDFALTKSSQLTQHDVAAPRRNPRCCAFEPRR